MPLPIDGYTLDHSPETFPPAPCDQCGRITEQYTRSSGSSSWAPECEHCSNGELFPTEYHFRT